jgi:tetratricopeptide (TPR) repeat protein
MTNPPASHDDPANDLEALLSSDASPEEFTRRLFALDYERTYAADPHLAWTMRACAIPRSFDAEIIGVLRGALVEGEMNERLLAGLLPFSFVLAHKDSGYVYHDNIRDLLLAEWQNDENRGEFEQIKQRLAGFYQSQGKEYYGKKEFEMALANFNRAIELGLEEQEIYFQRGRTQYQLRDYASVLADLNRAVELQPENGSNYQWRGTTHYKLQDYAAALADLNRAVELQPENGSNYRWRGMTHYKLQDYAAALADLNRAVELQPENGSFYDWRGAIQYRLGDYMAALADLNRAVELLPENSSPYQGRGQTQYQLQDYMAALADFNRAVKLQQDNGDNYIGRGLAYCQLRDYEAALIDLNRAVELKSDDLHNVFWRGVIYQLLNHLEAAQTDREQAASLAKTETNTCLQGRVLARIALLDSQSNSARDLYVQVLDGSCKPHSLRIEASYLQLLSRMFPDRDDIRAMYEWFEAQLGQNAN